MQTSGAGRACGGRGGLLASRAPALPPGPTQHAIHALYAIHAHTQAAKPRRSRSPGQSQALRPAPRPAHDGACGSPQQPNLPFLTEGQCRVKPFSPQRSSRPLRMVESCTAAAALLWSDHVIRVANHGPGRPSMLLRMLRPTCSIITIGYLDYAVVEPPGGLHGDVWLIARPTFSAAGVLLLSPRLPLPLMTQSHVLELLGTHGIASCLHQPEFLVATWLACPSLFKMESSPPSIFMVTPSCGKQPQSSTSRSS